MISSLCCAVIPKSASIFHLFIIYHHLTTNQTATQTIHDNNYKCQHQIPPPYSPTPHHPPCKIIAIILVARQTQIQQPIRLAPIQIRRRINRSGGAAAFYRPLDIIVKHIAQRLPPRYRTLYHRIIPRTSHLPITRRIPISRTTDTIAHHIALGIAPDSHTPLTSRCRRTREPVRVASPFHCPVHAEIKGKTNSFHLFSIAVVQVLFSPHLTTE